MSAPLFTVYSEVPPQLPQAVWRPLRWGGVLVGVGIAVAAIIDPNVGQHAFWSVFVPVAPLLFLVAPGLWRNTCPMASLNQLPRTLGFTRGMTLPEPVKRVAPLISGGLFLLIVPLRKIWLDGNGLALGVFLLAVLGLAFTGGFLFKGKSGWCSQFCPMLSVERFYNLAPIALVPNSHCRPCVGCTSNCYDFNPTAAQLADLHSDDPRWVDYRRMFAGLLPWLIVAFNTQDPVPAAFSTRDVATTYARLLLYCLAGAGGFLIVEAVTRLSAFHVQLLHVLAAINLFYWYVTPKALAAFSIDSEPLARVVQGAVLVVSLGWAVRAWPREQHFLESESAPRSRVSDRLLRAAENVRGDEVEVSFLAGPTALARAGEPLLAIAEANGVKIEAGCRMGMCGADPIKVLAGHDNLTVPGGSERSTLDRIGAGPGCRMACVAKVQGPVTVSTDLAATADGAETAPELPPIPAFVADRTVESVVIVGTGAAGVTAVNEIRKRAPGVHLTIVGAEPYDFYNRMNIGKLVSEATSIDKLYMLPKDWAEQRRIRALRGVAAETIDRRAREVVLDTGERVPYDRVVIATGSRGNTPSLEGFGATGTFVLRALDDGVAIQQYLRRSRAQTALVIGGGLLGLEAAYAMTSLGVRVYVLDRNPWPLNRQLDHPAGALLWQLMKDLGIEVLPSTEARRLFGDERGRLRSAELTDGRILRVEVCLAAAGVTPDVDLARRSGLAVDRGIEVSDTLATSDPEIFAAGDCVQHRGRTYGLWPACVDHARVAAINLLGGNARYDGDVPSCKLKVAGIDLLSTGELKATAGGDAYEIAFEEQGVRRYRKLVVVDGAIRGGMLIGYPELADRVATAVQSRTPVEGCLEQLRAGDWMVLAE